MDYISVKEASALWGIDTSNIGKLCRKGKIEGAKIVGRNWLIPQNAPRPVDGRTKKAKENVSTEVFRFPLFVNFPAESFVPPLSDEEATLRQAQVCFYDCQFEKAKNLFEPLCEHAENIYVKICAHFYMCVLSAVYDTDINWDKYYCRMNVLLSSDFPRKKEMELFLPWLDVIIGRFGKIPEKLNTDVAYEYHPTAWYLNALLSVLNFQGENTEILNAKCDEPFGTLCRVMERDGFFVEAQELHAILFFYHFGAHNEAAAEYHLEKSVGIGYERNLLFEIADMETYYTDAVNRTLRAYPDSFGERIRFNSKQQYRNFSGFAKETSKTDVYDRLSKSDYRYVFYAVEGFSNRQVADFCNVSERTVAKRYNDIYNKLGIDSKQELIAQMSVAFGNR